MNKRGSSVDLIYAAVIFFGFAITLFVVLVLWNAMTTTEMNAQLWDQTTQGTAMRNTMQGFYDKLDNIGLLAYFAVHIGVIALAFALRDHPVMLIAAILITVILAIVAAPLANAYEEVTSDPEFTGYVDDLQKVDYILRHFPRFEIIWACLTGIIMIGLARERQYL